MLSFLSIWSAKVGKNAIENSHGKAVIILKKSYNNLADYAYLKSAIRKLKRKLLETRK